jgi:hypothetical protein
MVITVVDHYLSLGETAGEAPTGIFIYINNKEYVHGWI